MTDRYPSVISLPVRIAAGATGMILMTLAIGSLFMQEEGAVVGGFLAGFLGLLLIIPALKSKRLQATASLIHILTKYRRARALQWLCLGVGAFGLFMLSRAGKAGVSYDFRLFILFMTIWLGGFAFAGFASYYLEQAKQLAPREDDAA